jgi:hypothetical protein
LLWSGDDFHRPEAAGRAAVFREAPMQRRPRSRKILFQLLFSTAKKARESSLRSVAARQAWLGQEGAGRQQGIFAAGGNKRYGRAYF